MSIKKYKENFILIRLRLNSILKALSQTNPKVKIIIQNI